MTAAPRGDGGNDEPFRRPMPGGTRMLDRILSNRAFNAAEGALDGLSARQAAIADNISNADTPGYKRKTVPFEAALARAVNESISPVTGAASNTVHAFHPSVVRETSTSVRADGNGVDMEREMVQLADNTLHYQTLTQFVQQFFQGLKSAIKGQ
jgi:flagellar basal-body rod protein FlgB